jgi:CubicO group peptidase (beta-lactamase class C family)
MIRKKLIISAWLFFLLLNACVNKEITTDLPRSIPEDEGVSSRGIINFLDAVSKSKNELHSIMFLRHGKVIAEGWWNPYRADLKHTLYSTSKSFTSTAVGFAVSEKLLSVDDKVISFFPEYLPDTVSPYLSELTVKDVLMMSDGQAPDPTFSVITRDSNWVKSFLALPIMHKPGTTFLYNSLGTYMLSAIVQKVTGQKIIDYLKPRLFDPLGIEGMDWEVDPRGINTGGWGLRLKTEDLAKFGQLYLQKGKWNDKQILPATWVEEATTFKIQQGSDWLPPNTVVSESDWAQGYCYQFWRCRHNAYRGDGAYGQYIIVMPEKDAVIAITSETANMQDEINLVWNYLLPAISADKLPTDEKSYLSLEQKLSLLALPLPEISPASSLENNVTDKVYAADSGKWPMDSLSFGFKENICNVTIYKDTSIYNLAFGSSAWLIGETTLKGPSLTSSAKANFAGLPPMAVAGIYRWKNEKTLELILRYIESPHTETILYRFDKDNISADIKFSTSQDNAVPLFKGVRKK